MKFLNLIFIYIILVSCNRQNINVLELNLDELTKYKIELTQDIHKNGINESMLSNELISEYLLNPSNVYINNVYDKDFLEKIIKRGDYLRSLNNYSVKQNEYLNFKRSLLPKPKSLTTVKKTNLLSLNDCVKIMENHCKGSNQQLIKYFESEFDGKIVYMFFTLSFDNPGYSCVSLMTPLGEDILSVDCKTNEVKVIEWNNIPGSPKIYL